MANVSREHILAEIRRTAAENAGTALGQNRFEEVTGIPRHAWRGKYWRNWSDALVEAGLSPNNVTPSHDRERLVASLIALVRKLGRFPTEADMRLERVDGATFPSINSLRRWLGGQPGRIAAVGAYVREHEGHEDVLALLPSQAEDVNATDDADHADSGNAVVDGHVYLMRFGKYYKIGRSEIVPTRHRQINLELPEKAELIHQIATDDAAGIEAYWHTRFAAKRTNGEWFALNRDDVRAFKRRRFM